MTVRESTVRILIAEDDAVSRRVLELTLANWGHEVTTATDGAIAWEYLQKPDAPPLAILDVMMPHVDGHELCRRARQLYGEGHSAPTYLILLTAKSQKDDIVAGLAAGADDYLTKPFNRDELRARIEVGARIIELQSSLAARVAELRVSEARYRHLVENGQGLICTHDPEGKLLFINRAAAEHLGYTPDEMIGENLARFMLADAQRFVPDYLARVRAQRADSALLPLVTKSGEERFWLYKSTCYEENGRLQYVLGHAQDVTELKRAEAVLQNLALTDELTGIYNRRGFLAFAAPALDSARRLKRRLALVYADMDGLKTINDTLGHDAGDEAIKDIAHVMRHTFRRRAFRPPDIVARLGGDEFVALIALDGEQDGGQSALDRLAKNLREYAESGERQYKLALSTGAVPVPYDADADLSLEKLIAEADARMYEHKRRKRLEAQG